jgi:catalase
VQTPAVRERVVSMLANVDDELASRVATGLGMPEVPPPMPKAMEAPRPPEVETSSALSLLARPGDGSIRTRRIAIMVADGVDDRVRGLQSALLGEGAVARFLGVRLGQVATSSGEPLPVEITFETAPSVLFDAVAIADGEPAIESLKQVGMALEFVKDQYRHCKPILAIGAGADLLEAAGVPLELPGGGEDPGVLALRGDGDVISEFTAAIGKHRHFERQSDPPLV